MTMKTIFSLVIISLFTLSPASISAKTSTVLNKKVEIKKVVPVKVVPKAVVKKVVPAPLPVTQPKKSNCNPNYSGCLKSGAGDYDCAKGSGNGPNYTGKVKVLGYDEFDLDRDSDGWGCE